MIFFFLLKFLLCDCESLAESDSRFTLSSGCYFIESNLYSNLHTQSNGGVCSIIGNVVMHVLDTTLESCSAQIGGAFYLVDNGESIFTTQRVCGYHCSSSSSSNFDYITLSSTSHYENSMTLTSLRECSNDLSSGDSTIRLVSGTVQINQLNVSLCSAISTACIRISGKIQNLCKYSNFADNSVMTNNFITTTDSRPEFYNINFIGNNQPSEETSALISFTFDHSGFIKDSVFNLINKNLLLEINGEDFTFTNVYAYNCLFQTDMETGGVISQSHATFDIEFYEADQCPAANGVTKSRAFFIASIVLICVCVVLIILFIIICICGFRSRMNEVYLGSLPESLLK